MSLLEEVLVIAIIAVVIFFALPAARQLFNSLETPSGTKSLISSALASARAIASREQQYVGIRFQHAWYDDAPEQSPLKMPQYMIFIEYKPRGQDGTTDQDIFTAIDGIEPIKLPENIGVMDMVIDGTNTIDGDAEIDESLELVDTTTFSIVFSPSGKMVVMTVQTRNRDNVRNAVDFSEDDVINTETNIEKGIAMFLQDAAPDNSLGLVPEDSRRAFIIYDRNIFRDLPKDDRYDRYLKDLKNREMIYINPYTGTFINK
ncbi:MAG: hypothetical protein WC374_08065 [Phycisphaerae bacterium]